MRQKSVLASSGISAFSVDRQRREGRRCDQPPFLPLFDSIKSLRWALPFNALDVEAF
jgi:hypothetical protein